LQESFGLFISSASINLYTNGCVLVISGVLGPTEAGLYSLADRMRQAVMGVFGPVSESLYPFVCRHVAENEKHGDGEGTRIIFFRAIAFLGLAVSICLYLLAPFGVALLGGKAFADSAEILRIMAPVPFLVALSNLLGVQTLIPHGLERHFSLVISTAGAIGIVAVALGALIKGLMGAAIAYVAVEIVITIVLSLIVQKKLGLARTFGWGR
jgi:PST family polysaccharide transporter